MKHFFKAMCLAALAIYTTGCGTTRTVVALPPSLCKPSTDLPKHKYLDKLPEVDTGNDTLYQQFLQERGSHAKDVVDYNSLYGTCVDPSELPNVLKVFAE